MKKLIKLQLIAWLILLSPVTIFSCSFSLYTESNGYAIGNFAAGTAAEARDASTAWYNPAGLAEIHQQEFIVAGVGIIPYMSLSGNTSFNTPVPPVPSYEQQFQHLNGAESGLAPSIYYALPLGDRATFALSFNVPFGLSTAWDPKSALRYGATYSKLLTLDFAPNIGGQITDNLAIGAGIDFQYAKVDFDSIVGAPAALDALDLDPTLWDSTSRNHGDSFGLGFHAGVLWKSWDSKSKVGINYQSQVRHNFKGHSTLTGYLASDGITSPDAIFETSIQTNDITFPDILTLSGYQDLNDNWAVLGSIVWTGWGIFKNIELNNVAGLYPNTVNVTAVENYHDAWRAALGLNFKWDNNLLLRVGGGYDETPTNNIDRDIRIPDASRWAIGAGGTYKFLKYFAADFGFSFMHAIHAAAINKTSDAGNGSTFHVNAIGDPYVYLIGGGLHGYF
jgi:long-chain fatty acid transport protein